MVFVAGCVVVVCGCVMLCNTRLPLTSEGGRKGGKGDDMSKSPSKMLEDRPDV